MTDQKPALSLRYALNLEESQDGFGLATFGKNKLPVFLHHSLVWELLCMDFTSAFQV
jgi:hypothetical protein